MRIKAAYTSLEMASFIECILANSNTVHGCHGGLAYFQSDMCARTLRAEKSNTAIPCMVASHFPYVRCNCYYRSLMNLIDDKKKTSFVRSLMVRTTGERSFVCCIQVRQD